MPSPQNHTQHENDSPQRIPWAAVSSLAGLLGLRMLGLFMVLPVLAIHVQQMPGTTPFHAGLALGVYGLTQAALQLPFGKLSDRWGRKPVIALGLLIFMAGSVLAAFAETVSVLVLGRALQGAGAISAAVTAFVGDITPPQRRARAMALIGIAIGTAFMLSFIAGPMLSGIVGVPGLFWISAGLAGLGLAMLLLAPAAPPPKTNATVPLTTILRRIAPEVAGVFLLHALLMAGFLVIPELLVERAGIPLSQHGWVYLPVLLGSLLLLAPLVLIQERLSARVAMLLALLLLAAGQAAWLITSSAWWLYFGLMLFFGGFNSIEAFLPARVSVLAKQGERGGAMGLFATAQFLGAFAGGVFGGLLAGQFGPAAVIWAGVLVAALWFIGLRRYRSSEQETR